MLPQDTSTQSRLEVLTRLLAAVCIQAGGELKISGLTIHQLEDSEGRQALFYDEDRGTGEIMLRYGSRASAVFPVEPCRKQATSSTTSTILDPLKAGVSPSPGEPRVRKPLTDEYLAKAEKKIRAARVVLNMKREQEAQQPVSSER